MRFVLGIAFILSSFDLFSQKEYFVIDTMIVGHFDAAKGKDTAYLMVSNLASEMFSCKMCDAEIRFSS